MYWWQKKKHLVKQYVFTPRRPLFQQWGNKNKFHTAEKLFIASPVISWAP